MKIAIWKFIDAIHTRAGTEADEVRYDAQIECYWLPDRVIAYARRKAYRDGIDLEPAIVGPTGAWCAVRLKEDDDVEHT